MEKINLWKFFTAVGYQEFLNVNYMEITYIRVQRFKYP